MANPLVSICVPTYNRPSLLRESLRTIRAQDYAPLEILISDNCSDDETGQLCHEIAQVDPRVRYVCQPRNIGMHANHNFCIEESRGEFLCFFHDDDLYDPQIIGCYVEFLHRHPEVGIVCSDWELINGAGELIGVRDHKVKPVTAGLEYIDRTMRSGQSSIGCPGAMIRRSALGDARFDEKGPTGFGDFVLWFQIAERSAVGHVHRRLWRYRLHDRSFSRRKIESIVHDYHETLTRYCDEYLERWPGHAEMVDRWRAYINRYLFWALAYEVGLYFRKVGSSASRQPHHRTVFEITDYRLTPEEFRRVLEQLRAYRSGFVRYAVLFVIDLLVRMKLTWPLAWVTHYSSLLRYILGLR